MANRAAQKSAFLHHVRLLTRTPVTPHDRFHQLPGHGAELSVLKLFDSTGPVHTH